MPFSIYARYQPVPAQTKVVGTRSVPTTLDSWLGNILTSMPFITTLKLNPKYPNISPIEAPKV